MNDEDHEHVFKFIIIGNAGTGKSCILHQFVELEFKKGPVKHTVGVEFGSKVMNLGNARVKLQVWDTAGQERFRSVCHSYYRKFDIDITYCFNGCCLGGAMGALIVYDISNQESFDALAHWVEDARALAGNDVCIVLCGNKSDLVDEREVELLEASRFAQENNSMFLETSALTGQNINEVFLMCARAISAKIESGILKMPGEEAFEKLQDSQDDKSLCSC